MIVSGPLDIDQRKRRDGEVYWEALAGQRLDAVLFGGGRRWNLMHWHLSSFSSNDVVGREMFVLVKVTLDKPLTPTGCL